MANMLILFCKFEGESYVLKVENGDTFQTFVLNVCSKWSCLKKELVSLFYCLPGHPKCVLNSEDDFQSLLCVSSSFGINRVEVEVVKTDGGASSSGCKSMVLFEEADMAVEVEDDMLSSFCQSEKRTLNTIGWDKAIFGVGQKFEGGSKEFRMCLTKLAVNSGFQFKYVKNNAVRIKAVCARSHDLGCSWMVVGTKEHANGFFYVRKFNDVHICGVNSRCVKGSRMISSLVASLIVDQVRVKPSIRPVDVLQQVRSDYGIHISYDNAWSSVEKAKKCVYGDLADSFNDLQWYIRSLQETNPDSYIVLEVDEVDEGKRFKRLFVAFGASIKGFNFCRPTLSLDGTHLKSHFKGHMLSATGKDPNQGLFPLSFGVVDSENEENWEWFCYNLRQIIPLGRRLTFLSDRNLGLVAALPRVFPDGFHGYCLYHLTLNMKDKCRKHHSSKAFRNRMVYLLKECAYAPTIELYQAKMDLLLREGHLVASEFFQNLNPENWANAYFQGSRYGDMCSSASESFNSWVVSERFLPVTSMIDAIRTKLMKWFCERRIACLSWVSELCPEIDRKLAVSFAAGKSWAVLRSTDYIFQVMSTPSFTVDIQYCKCSCCMWQITQLPCDHAVACIMSTGIPLSRFVPKMFTTKFYADCYQFPLYPVPTFGKPKSLPIEDAVHPPSSRRPPGRPRTKRIRSRGEVVEVRRIRCGRCRRLGHHNKKSCVEPLDC